MLSVSQKRLLVQWGFARRRAETRSGDTDEARAPSSDAPAHDDLAWLSLCVADPAAAEAAERDTRWLTLSSDPGASDVEPFPGDRWL